MKITLSNDPKDEGEEGIVYVPLSLFASIVATLHERELLPKAQSLPTQRAADGANGSQDNDRIDDGFGQAVSAWCPNGCGKTMGVDRPGMFSCSVCGE